MIGVNIGKFRWHSIFSELNAPVDFINEYFPMLKKSRMSKVVDKIKNYICKKNLTRENVVTLIENAIRRGFGSLLFDKIPSKEELKIDYLLNNKELIAKCLYIAAYVLPCKGYQDIDHKEIVGKEDILWIGREEKITIRGYMTCLMDNDCYLIEDRQSHFMYQIRDDKNIHSQVSAKEKYRFHTININQQAIVRFQHILANIAEGDHTEFLNEIKELFIGMDITPSGQKLTDLSNETAAYKTAKPSRDLNTGVNSKTFQTGYDLDKVKEDIKNSRINIMDVKDDLWKHIIENNECELFELMLKELYQNLKHTPLKLMDKISLVTKPCHSKPEFLKSVLVKKQRELGFQGLSNKIDPSTLVVDVYVSLLCNDNEVDKFRKIEVCQWRLEKGGYIPLNLAKSMFEYITWDNWEKFFEKVYPRESVDELLIPFYRASDEKIYLICKEQICEWRLKRKESINRELARAMNRYIKASSQNRFKEKVFKWGLDKCKNIGLAAAKKVYKYVEHSDWEKFLSKIDPKKIQNSADMPFEDIDDNLKKVVAEWWNNLKKTV